MITEINFSDVPSINAEVTRYFDGEMFFADNVTSVPQLARVFKVKFIGMVFCLRGELEVRLNSAPYVVRQHDALFVNASTVVDLVRRTNDFSCKICAVTPDVGFNFINKTLFDAAMRVHAHPVIHFTEDEITLMLKYYELADFKLSHAETNYSRESVSFLLRAYAYDLLHCVSSHLGVGGNLDMLRQGDKLFRRFVVLLADNTHCSRSVNWFAAELCVSPKYLTSVCRQHSNKTAGELIATSMVARIKQMLLYSDLSIKEIAAELGFSNLSFFGKYVKKHLGQSPNNYRMANGYGR
ncbi:MAG: AraC family transcriptional regulator [Muribaculaceae bacterium]|nr:AraC family transcriptional regulator [Muribaculaceae bacterium]